MKIFNGQKCVINFIILFFVFESLNLFVKLCLGEFSLWGIISKGTLFIALVPALVTIVKNKRTAYVLVMLEIVFVFLVILTFVAATASDGFYKNIVYVGGIYIPLGCCVCAVEEKKELIRELYKWSLIPVILLFVTMIGFSDGLYNYSMPCSYALIFWVIIVADHYLNDRKTGKDIAVVGISLLLILLKGSRGSLVCFIAYVLFSQLLMKKRLTEKKAKILMAFFLFIVAFLFLYWTSFFSALYNILVSRGHQSRILWTLSGNLTYDSGRSSIYLDYMNKISDHWLMGHGLFGGIVDGMALPHNSVLEVMFYFGAPVGILLLIIFICSMIKLCRQSKYGENSRWMIIVISILVSTLFSNELFMSPFFYMGIAVVIKDRKIRSSNRVSAHMMPYGGAAS